jgi:hypothetical protein
MSDVFEKLTLERLLEIAKYEGFSGYCKMDKTQLIDFLVDNMSDYRLLKHILQLANHKKTE